MTTRHVFIACLFVFGGGLVVNDASGIAGYIDVETTGLDPYNDQIIEFSIVLFEFNRFTAEITKLMEEYVGLEEPTFPIPKRATKVHGITMKMVEGHSLDYKKINSMIERAEFLVSHNARFDRSFVSQMFPMTVSKPWLCSMNGISWRRKGFVSIGLHNLLRDHGIEIARSHRALDDVKAAIRLLSQKNNKGEYYLKELIDNHQRKVALALKKAQQSPVAETAASVDEFDNRIKSAESNVESTTSTMTEPNSQTMSCNRCNKTVEIKESYKWQLGVIGFLAWCVASLVFKLGSIWSVVVALVVARIFSGFFKKKTCSECGNAV